MSRRAIDRDTVVPCFVFTAGKYDVLNVVAEQLIRQRSASGIISGVVRKWTYSIVTSQSPEARSTLEMHYSNELNTEVRIHR